LSNYESDDYLADSVSRFFQSGLSAGEVALIISTPAHLHAVERCLNDADLDVTALRAEGRYVPLDAAATLAKFMVDGAPDPTRFEATIGRLVARAARGKRPLRLFGVMVALLWADGQADAAIEVERLWNALQERHVFKLFCAYPMRSFSCASADTSFLHICQAHRHVIPAENYAAPELTDDDRLRTIACLQQKAVALETEVEKRKHAETELNATRAALERAHAELERRVQQRTASLHEAVEQLEEFSYTVSHDLRAPLRGMQVYSEALLEDHAPELNAEARHCATRIAENAARLDRMVNDVLAFSRISRHELLMRPLDPGRLVRDLVQHYPTMQPPHAEIDIASLAPVLGHEPSLTQALSNLLTNAVKFVAPGVTPKIQIWTETHANRVRLWIQDNGIGIPPDHQNRLFKIFERAHAGLSYDGTGVGLAIVRKAAVRMGGDAGVESDGANGSRFWIDLRPARPRPAK